MPVEEPPAQAVTAPDAPDEPDAPDDPGTPDPREAPGDEYNRSPDTTRDGVGLRVVAVRIVVITLILALGAAVFAGLYANAPTLDTAAAEQVRTRVLVFAPRPVPVQRQWRGYGTARPLHATNVPARVTATVESIPDRILEGASVQRGELLVQLDDRDFRAEVDRIDAALAETDAALDELAAQRRVLEERLALAVEDVQIAEDELARVRDLTGRNVTSAQDVDRARTLLLAARRVRTQTQETLTSLPPRRAGLQAQRRGLQAQRRLAERDYERAQITAPIAGVLQSVDVEPGESVSPGQQVARVVDPSIIEVPVQLPAAARRFVSVGDRAVLRPTNQSGRAFDAEISRIAPEDNEQTRTLTAFALLNQEDAPPNEALAPGTFVEVDVASGEPTPRLVVPRRALRKQRVQAVEDVDGVPTIRSVPVEVLFSFRGELPATGLDDDQWAVLAEGALPAGARVLATSSSSVLDGQAVEAVALGGQATDEASGSGRPRAEARSPTGSGDAP